MIPTIDRDSRIEAFAKQAQAYVKAFSYRDRMEGIPIHDEQGTRDRPYDLTVDFHPEKIDEILLALGQKPWTAHRPTIVVILAVKYKARSYLLTGDADEGFDQRESFMSAAWLTGMPMVLPSSATLNEAGMTAEKLPTAESCGPQDELRGQAVAGLCWLAVLPGTRECWDGKGIGSSIQPMDPMTGKSRM